MRLGYFRSEVGLLGRSSFMKLYFKPDELVSMVRDIKDELVIGEFNVREFIESHKDGDEDYVRYSLLYSYLENYFSRIFNEYYEILGNTGEDDNILVIKVDDKLVSIDIKPKDEREDTILIMVNPIIKTINKVK